MSKHWKNEEEAKKEETEEKEKQVKEEKKEQAKTMLFDKLAKDFILGTDLSDEEKDIFINIFNSWEVGKDYQVGDKLVYKDIAYEVIQAHTSQSDWLPSDLPSLYKVIYQTTTSEGEKVIPDFEQPTSTNFYSKGDKVLFEGKIYESLIDNNTYSPKEYPQGWREIQE